MRYQLGKAIVELADSRGRMGGAVAFSGICAGLLEYAIHNAITRADVSTFVQSLVDAAVVATAVAAVVFVVLVSARARRRKVLDDVRKIAELNHHIRNALQIVIDSQYLPPSDEKRKAVLASVDRIENTLRELFPVIGERIEDRQWTPAEAAGSSITFPKPHQKHD